jgi:hypothetical protein
VTVVVRHRCPSVAIAHALRAAVAADNPPYVTVELDGPELVVRLTTASAASARTTLEDLLACLSAAERALPSAPSG